MDQLSQLLQTLSPILGYVGDNHYLQAFVLLVFSLGLALLLNWLLTVVVKKLLHKTNNHLDDQIAAIMHRPLFYSVLLLGLGLAVRLLQLADGFELFIMGFLKTLAIWVWAVFLLRLAKLVLRHMSRAPDHFALVRMQTLPLFENMAFLLILGAAMYLVFTAWHIDMTAWLASAGIVGIAVGFAAKDTLANLFSGVFILADAPYKIGDYVVLDTGERGEVTHIGIRSTRLLTRDDVEVTIPNAIMGNTKIINESGGPYEKSRIRLKVSVAYGSDIEQVRQILLEAAEEAPDVCATPEPRVRFRDFGDSGLLFELLFWIDQPMLRGRVLDALNSTVYQRFQQESVEIPYPKRDLYIKQMPAD